MIKIIFCICVVVGSFSILLGQSITFINEENNNPLEDVMVYKDNTLIGISDNKGVVVLEDIAINDTLIFSHISFYNLSMSFQEVKENKFVISLSPRTIFLQEAVISVSKTKENTSSISNKVDVIRAKDISFFTPSTSADLMEQTGNVFIQKSQFGGGSPIIRGFEANKVMIVMDGIRMNNVLYRGGHLQNIISIDENMLDRVEVVYGPGSLIYGSDALGGVMSFLTKKPKLAYIDSLDFSGLASIRYATATKEKTIHSHFNFGKKKYASLTSISASDFGDLTTGKKRNPLHGSWGLMPMYAKKVEQNEFVAQLNDKPHVVKNSGYNQLDLMQKFLFEPNKDYSITLNTQYSSTSNIPRSDQLDRLSITQEELMNGMEVFADTTIFIYDSLQTYEPRFAEWFYGPQKRGLVALHVLDKTERKMYNNAQYTLSYQYEKQSRNSRRFGKNIFKNTTDKVHVATLNIDFRENLKTGNYVLFGIESNYNMVQSSAYGYDVSIDSIYLINTRYPDGGCFFASQSLYVKHNLLISKRATLSQGVRVNYNYLKMVSNDQSLQLLGLGKSILTGSAFSGGFDVSINATKELWINFMFSTGFRTPNVDDAGKFFNGNPGELVVPNSNLKPEYSYNFELSLRQIINERIKIEFLGYHSLLVNLIERGMYSIDGQDSVFLNGEMLGFVANQNLGKAYITGLSTNVKIEMHRNLSLTSSFNFTYGRTGIEGTPLAHIPPVFGRTEINYKREWFRGNVSCIYNGWKKLRDYSPSSVDNLDEALEEYGTPPWWVLNLNSSYQIKKYLTLSIGIHNLLDIHYRPFSSGISAMGRNFTLGLSLSLN